MPRDPSGNYTLPALGNPAVTNTPITIAWWNNTSTDIAAALTDSLSRSGNGGMLGPFGAVDGTSALPGLTFQSETNTGLYRPVAGEMDVTIGGARITRWTSAGFLQTSFDNGVTWYGPIYFNRAGQAFTSGSLDFTAGTLTVGGANVGPAAINTLSANSSGTFTTGSGTYVAVNGGAGNVTAGFTAVSGRPVLVQLVSDGTGVSNFSFVNTTPGILFYYGQVALSADGGATFFAEQIVVGYGNPSTNHYMTVFAPVSTYSHLYVPSAGAVTIGVYAKCAVATGTPTFAVTRAKLSVTQF